MPNEFHDVSHATEFLQSVHPFDLLETLDLQKLARNLEAAYYPHGKRIFTSQSGAGLAIIRKGAVRLVGADRKFLDRRGEGELFGHEIHFHGEVKDYAAEAEEDSLIWHLGAEAFTRIRSDYSILAEYFDSQLQSRLSQATQAPPVATRLRELLQRRPVMVDQFSSIRESARKMSDENVSSVLVMTGDELCGIVTDKDLRHRVLAAGLDSSRPIQQVMTANPMCLPAAAGVDQALLLMMRENYHHLPVVEDGKPLGLVTAGDILRAQSEHPLRVVRDIHKKSSVPELLQLSRRLPALFERMVNLGREVEQIGRMVTLITDAFTLRLIHLAEKKFGSPPMAFAWLAFGSQGREEQTARTDQDNGLVLAAEPNEVENEYFAHLSEFVCGGLDQLGYEFCPGEVMAQNPAWRVSLDAWKRHFDRWIDEPDPKSVMHSSIFFDIRCVHGDRSLVTELQSHAMSRAKENRIFRRFMAGNALNHRPPLGFFRRFVQEHDGSQSEGLNLKHRGIVPITDLVRMRALEAGISEANTFTRIEKAAEAGLMNESDARSLRDALVLIGRIRLTHQSAQMAAGEKPGHFVPPEELSPLTRRNLKAAFMVVLEAQDALALRYQVH